MQQPPQTCTDLNEILHTHKTTSIFVIDVKFHKNPLFCLRDVQFFQTAVTNLSYRYNLLLADVIRDVDHLKERLIEEWRHFDQNIIDRAVNQWRDRLHNCVRAKGDTSNI